MVIPMKKTLFVTVFLLLSISVASAQSRTPVWVEHESVDTIGRQFAYALREQLGHSVAYPLVDSEDSSSLIVHLVTVDPMRGLDRGSFEGSVTAISWALTYRSETFRSYFLTSGIQVVGRLSIDEMARSLLGAIDASTQALLRDIDRYATAVVKNEASSLIGSDAATVEERLGKPSRIDGKRWTYDTKTGGLRIYFDDSNKVIDAQPPAFDLRNVRIP